MRVRISLRSITPRLRPGGASVLATRSTSNGQTGTSEWRYGFRPRVTLSVVTRTRHSTLSGSRSLRRLHLPFARLVHPVASAAEAVLPNKRLKLAGGDRFKGSGVLCPWRGTDFVPRPCAGGRVARSLSAIR